MLLNGTPPLFASVVLLLRRSLAQIIVYNTAYIYIYIARLDPLLLFVVGAAVLLNGTPPLFGSVVLLLRRSLAQIIIYNTLYIYIYSTPVLRSNTNSSALIILVLYRCVISEIRECFPT